MVMVADTKAASPPAPEFLSVVSERPLPPPPPITVTMARVAPDGTVIVSEPTCVHETVTPSAGLVVVQPAAAWAGECEMSDSPRAATAAMARNVRIRTKC